nr:DNA topoisomerase 2 [Tanacetum cinerariifolium]
MYSQYSTLILVEGESAKNFAGLGSHSIPEAKKYFENFDEHVRHFKWVNNEDDDAFDLVFSKKRAPERKNWILTPQDGTHHEPINEKCIRFLRYFNTEYKEFGRANIRRSIPSIVDGFTIVRRKILCTAFKYITETSLTTEDFGGHVSTLTVYHYGNTSLELTIQRMSHGNIINLLKIIGEIDIEARYLEIELHRITQYIFHKDDELLLNYLNEDGIGIVPVWKFIPIISMVLVNRADGVAIGCRKKPQAMRPSYKARDDVMNKSRKKGLSTANIYVLDAEGKLRILEDFYNLRLCYYKERKKYLLYELSIASLQLKSKERFTHE